MYQQRRNVIIGVSERGLSHDKAHAVGPDGMFVREGTKNNNADPVTTEPIAIEAVVESNDEPIVEATVDVPSPRPKRPGKAKKS